MAGTGDGIVTGNGASEGRRDSAGVIAFPPLLYLAAFAAGGAWHLFLPVATLPAAGSRVAGGVLLAAGVGLALWAMGTFRRAGTNVLPSNPALTVVTRGPYRWTRNPMYLAFAAAFAGLSLLIPALEPLVLLPPLLALVEWGVIRREERYMAANFGEPYVAYKARVRRWL
jgi:protein-S-isoprenylcysteine O-methyltransferase Ste14